MSISFRPCAEGTVCPPVSGRLMLFAAHNNSLGCYSDSGIGINSYTLLHLVNAIVNVLPPLSSGNAGATIADTTWEIGCGSRCCIRS